jgi:hypothetical protein
VVRCAGMCGPYPHQCVARSVRIHLVLGPVVGSIIDVLHDFPCKLISMHSITIKKIVILDNMQDNMQVLWKWKTSRLKFLLK